MGASALLNVMVKAARAAARSLNRDFGEVEQLQVSVKGPGDFVTLADKRAERIIQGELAKARPGYGFLLEEAGVIEGADKTHRWIVDPLDGTTNFLHSIPLFTISIALEREGELVAGVIYNPVSDELFTAEKGQGAFVNDRRLRVSGRKQLADAVLTTGIPHSHRGDPDLFAREFRALSPLVAGLRRTGSAALDLAWLAAGRFDGYWERGLAAWDVAAGIVMVREAGGMVSDCDGKRTMLESGHILAANTDLHPLIEKALKSATV
jgi:myo-inositol-1(or 4)-monophosphatase